MYYLNSRYYDPEVGRFINADGYVTTGQGFLSYNMFAYCLNNSINCSDLTGNVTEPMWKQLGFRYNGTMGDYRRMEAGLAPIEYVNWLRGLQEKKTEISRVKVEEMRLVGTSVTNIPANEVKKMRTKIIDKKSQIKKPSSNEIISHSVVSIINHSIKIPSYITIGVDIVQGVILLEKYYNEMGIAAFENAVYDAASNDQSILVVKWEIQGDSAIQRTSIGYYPWDESNSPF